MCHQSAKNMNKVTLFVVLHSVFSIGTQAATQPFVIFQPGEFFDPFTEKPFKELQSSASITPQSKVVFSEKENMFIQPFWNLPIHSTPNSYPRIIAQTSGSASQVDAQIRQPSKPLGGSSSPIMYEPKTLSNSETNTPETLDKVPKIYLRKVARNSGSAHQLRQPQNDVTQTPASLTTNPKPSETTMETINNNLETLRRLTAEAKKVPWQPKLSQNKGSRSRNYRDRGAKPSTLVAEASGQSNRLIDQSSELVAYPSNYGNHAASKSQGGGRSDVSGHHDSHSDKDVEDYKTDHIRNIKDFKKYDDHNKKSHQSENGGNQNEHHDEAGHYKKHHEGKKSHKAAKFGEKKGHKRGHKTKGYHNKFHRDEYHKEHKFYDDYHKEGYHEKHGDDHSHHRKKQGEYKNGGGHKSGKNSKKHGKKGFSDKGNVIDEHKGFDREGGRKKYNKHHKDYHKKQGNSRGSQHGYTKKH